ncbi:MAG TPA: pilus assembly protein PilM [Thiobacillaceae bacterium]|nr:pilus assembly protein PilM [Nitrospira sp.]HNA28413.1 pilus assembly protein PilM [Thiobacillaceae bacterium]HNA81665.1 pilus assembly protein PilM [Thiobacillaceae bacterium]HNF87882.1 pilus assembly protein PilM [Thiobacillaceae bacterium]HNH87841.1 pilus assembly protein PilM [Thiobacillaceae bacterium]
MSFSLFGQGTRPLIGVDVSSSAVKMLELADSGKGMRRVERYAIVPLPKDAVLEGAIAKPDLVEAAMREAWKQLDTRSREVAMALPASSVITKRILLPGNATEAEIDTQVSAEANQVASFPLGDVSLDYQVLGPNSKNPAENDALLVLARRERVEERVAAAESVGLKCMVMDVDAFAALTAYEQMTFQLPDSGKGQVIAIVDIGANTTHVNVLHDNQTVYQREHALGGNTLTSEISRRFDLPVEEAEDAKRKNLLPDSYESEVLQPFLDSVAKEIGRALQLFFSATSFQRVDHIMLAGGCAAIPGLDDVVHSKMQTSTLIANPFSKMAVSSHVKARQLASDAPALFVACGLALRRFDPA